MSAFLYGGIGDCQTIVRPAVSADLQFIDDLRRKESENLGFVPLDVYRSVVEAVEIHPGRLRWRYQVMYVATDNNDLTGFCYASLLGQWAHIFQVAVRDDARRLQRAMLMVRQVEEDANYFGKIGLACRVATDIEANTFWMAAGFQPVTEVRGGSARKRILRVYHKHLTSMFIPLKSELIPSTGQKEGD